MATLVGDGGNNTLAGTIGADSLSGLGADDSLSGLGGNDSLNGGLGNDTLDGGTGTDLATYGSDTAGIVANLTTGVATGSLIGADVLIGIERLVGGSGGDFLTGDSGANTLTGNNGNDTLQGSGGNDSITGDGGADTVVYTSSLSNYTFFVSGANTVVANNSDIADTDTITGVETFQYSDGTLTAAQIAAVALSYNYIPGTVSNDVLGRTSGADSISTFAGNDTIFSVGSGDVVDAGDGNDSLDGSSGTATIQGGAGDDSFSAYHGGAYSLDGGSGNDTFFGVSSNDTTFGAPGVDTITGGAGVDFYRLVGEGIGVLNAGAPVADIITDFQTGAGGDVLDIFNNNIPPRNPFGQGYVRFVQSGNDTFLQTDPDAGGITYTWRTVLVLQNTTAAAFTADNLSIAFNPQASPGVILNGTTGPDTLVGSLNDDTISGDDGNDSISGLDGDDSLSGWNGSDTLDGGAGADTISGNGVLLGGAGDDSLIGGFFNDRLGGGSGDDTLVGDTGQDTFLFSSLNDLSASGDHIRDLSPNDTIDLSGIGGLHFIGTAAFSGSAGEYRYSYTSLSRSLLIDSDGDRIADKAIVFDNAPLVLAESSPGSNMLASVPTVFLDGGGTTGLTAAANLFYLQDRGNTPIVLTYQGSNVTAGQFGAWTPIGAEITSSGFEVAWQNGAADQYSIWSTDANGAYVATLLDSVPGSDFDLQLAENLFQQDLNGDRKVGLRPVPIESNGVTILSTAVNQFYLLDAGGFGPVLKYQGSNFVAGQLGAWVPFAAETLWSHYEVAWFNASTNQYMVWNTDLNGNYTGDVVGAVAGWNGVLQSRETFFHQDLNGDGRIGLPDTTAIETRGAITLAAGGNLFYLQDSSGGGPVLSSNGANVAAGQYGAWNPIGAETTGSGYEVAWKNGGADQYTLWAVDANGNYAGNIIGNVSGADPTLQSAETLFQQDLNGDGVVGPPPFTLIENHGVTKLVTASNRFYLQDSNGAGPVLSSGGADVLAGQYGAWKPIGAEKTDSGYEVAWKNGSADQYTLWAVDANGAYAGNIIGNVPGSDAALQTAEVLFQQDLNNDGHIGAAVNTSLGNLIHVTLSDPGALYTAQATQITNDAIAALAMWLPNLAPAVGSLDVNITITNATGANVLADTAVTSSQFVGVDNGINVLAPGFAFEFATGVDPNGSSPDLQIRINSDHLATDLWIDPLNGSPLPQNKVDLVDVLAHELAHGFAFTGLRDRSNGALSGNSESTFDRYVTFVNSVPYFTGPHAEAVYGGPVPLTINSLYHVGNQAPAPGSDIATDLMYAAAHFGRTQISPLDVAILSDCGVPTILSDMLVGGSANDTMNGGAGDDTIEGAAGDDSLTGGAGRDVFLFASLNDLSANADHISDFDNTDVIDLSSIGGLHFIGGAAFSGSVGEVRYQSIGQTTSVQIDADGDGVSDRGIVIDNGAFPLAETSTGSHVLSAALPVVVTTFIETIGATKLGTANNRFYLQDSGGSDPVLSSGGANVLAGQYGAWTPIGAEKTGSGYELAWKNGSADLYTLWAVDASGNYAGNMIGNVSGSDATLQSAETLFQQDLNGDGRVGLAAFTTIESHGATTLASAGNWFYLQDSGGNGPVLSSGGANVLAGQYGAWTPIAAETTGSGGYEIAWKNGSADQYTLWAVDANGNYAGNMIGNVSGSDATLQSAETLFQQDLNGDGRVGLAAFTTIESHGATTLASAGNWFYLQDSGGNGPILSSGGANVLAGQYGAWTPIAAEKTGSGYELAWKNGSADQYTLWAVDANGNYAGNLIGNVPGSDTTLQSAEALFQQDINGDGRVGLAAFTTIESNGATTLAAAGNRFYLQDSGGNGPVLSSGGANVLAGQFGAGWTPIAAEKSSSGYEVAWKNGSADQYTLWAVDANGNYAGNLIGSVSGADPTLQAAETLFQQDLNNDGHFGLF